VKELIGLCAALLAGAALGAETYKWVDERGVTNYGEKPPAGRPARVVNTQPAGTVEADGVQAKRSEPGSAASRMSVAPAPVATAVPPVTGPVRGMDFQTFVNLRTGMSEGTDVTGRASRLRDRG
jgi:hypothetical protein